MKIKRCLCLALVSLLCLSACSGPAANEAATNAPETTKQESSAGQTEAPQTTAPAETPGDVVVTMPVASRANGVITAGSWTAAIRSWRMNFSAPPWKERISLSLMI